MLQVQIIIEIANRSCKMTPWSSEHQILNLLNYLLYNPLNSLTKYFTIVLLFWKHRSLFSFCTYRCKINCAFICDSFLLSFFFYWTAERAINADQTGLFDALCNGGAYRAVKWKPYHQDSFMVSTTMTKCVAIFSKNILHDYKMHIWRNRKNKWPWNSATF